MSEEIISLLSNMGAIKEEKAVSMELLESSQHLKKKELQEEVENLEKSGYIRHSQGKLYLTSTGLLRALTRYS